MARRKKCLVNKGGVINTMVNHFIFFDTETKQHTDRKKIGMKEYDIIVNELWLGSACYWNRELDIEDWIDFNNRKDFYKWVMKIINKTKNAQVWFIAHNIEFDNIILDMWEFFKDHKFESEFIHSKGMVFIQKFKNRSKKTIYFVNNANIFPAKLETIAETIGLKKMEVNFEKDSFEYVLAYCVNDVRILVDFWRQWIKFIQENNLGKLKFTISSQSMEAFRKKFCKHYILLDDNLENLEFERQAYYGGRTECFHVGKVNKPVYYYDINSMYPFVMSEYRFPTEYKFSHNNPKISYVKNLINKGWLVVAECYLDTDENCYPFRDTELLFPTGKFKTYLSTPEIIHAMEKGHLIKFGKVSYYHGNNIFKEYVEFFYNKRQELKKAGNKQESMYKLFLNSLYGKFGQKMDKWHKIDEDEILKLYPNFSLPDWLMGFQKLEKLIFDGVDVTPRIRYIGGELQQSGEEEESDISFPAIAAHVTAYARMLLSEYMKYCKDNDIKIYYCDTDSVFIDKELPADYVSSSILGKLKLEKCLEYGIQFFGLKNYAELNRDGFILAQDENKNYIKLDDESIILNESKIIKGDKWKLKGVKNNAEIIDKNLFLQQEWSGLPKQQYYSKFGRKAGQYWIVYVTKFSRNEIKKGELLNDGTVIPFELNNIGG